MFTIEYSKGLPVGYESFLIQKYDSYMTTCRYIEVYCSSYNPHYMLVKEQGELTDLLLFGDKGNEAICFNSNTAIDKKVMEECINELFKACPTVQRIGIVNSYAGYKFPRSYMVSQANDYIIELPRTLDEYTSQLGSSTRKNIRNAGSKFSRDYPRAKHVVLFGNEIGKDIIRRIIELNIERMKHKGIVPGKSEMDIELTFRLSQHYGCAAYIEIDGAIAAGNISYIMGKRIFSQVIAHDDNYSRYNLGTICQMDIIQLAIEKKLAALHLMWGDNEYKKRLRGKPQALHSYCVHRHYNNYLVGRINALAYMVVIGIRHSKYSKPLKEAIKNYRKNKWKDELNFL
ncbi:MAG TPA: GNAT family N-acetyltransferase [Paludibacter sp.]|nr:GNAT family N-acetyltransferase [Paludibacter sp.]